LKSHRIVSKASAQCKRPLGSEEKCSEGKDSDIKAFVLMSTAPEAIVKAPIPPKQLQDVS
jgi:hypothetical protein